MKRDNGSSLLEIIISVAIIGIMIASFLPLVAKYYQQIYDTKIITSDIFTAQKAIELEIQNVKTTILGNATPTGKTSYTLFTGIYQRTVSGYPRTVTSSDNRNLFTIIADTRMPEFKTASVSSVQLKLWNGAEIPYAYAGTNSLSIKSFVTISDPDNVNLLNINRWYLSREGFNINPSETASPLEIEIGTVYPRFPDDYTILPLEKSASITAILSKYAGRFIVYTATPASKSGKMGSTSASNAVFISALPIIDGLKVHLDASAIAKNDTVNSVRIAGSNIFVKKWYDVSGNGIIASQGTTSKQPLMIEDKFGDFTSQNGIVYGTYSKYISFVDSSDVLKTNKTALNENVTFTSFIVLRDINSALVEDDNWHVFKGDDNLSAYQVDNGMTVSGSLHGISLKNGVFTIGNSIVDIAEIVIYNRTLTAVESDAVNQYLLKKYKPSV